MPGQDWVRSGTGWGGIRPARLETAGQWQPPEEDTGHQPSPYLSKDVLRAFTYLEQVLEQVLAAAGQAWGSEGPEGKSCPPPAPGGPSHTLLGWSLSCLQHRPWSQRTRVARMWACWGGGGPLEKGSRCSPALARRSEEHGGRGRLWLCACV